MGRSLVIRMGIILGVAANASAVNWPAVTLTPYVAGVSAPVDVVSPRDGSGRLFVVQQSGQIVIVTNGAIAGTLLNISDRVLNSGEQGLLGAAFPAGFATSRHFYVCYTDPGWTSVVSRFRLVPGNDSLADTNSEEQLLRVHQPYANHNGGQIGFSPSNNAYLYIGFGDGGSGNDPSNHAQNTSQLLGKMLRIGVEPPNGTNYTIPPDNPFVGDGGYRPEIWALGLRNPWRWAFDRLTADLYIADVGQNAWEEVNFQPASSPGGENYGWRSFEGNHCTGLNTCDTNGLTMPVAEYSHSLGCSITGGKVYRGVYYSYMYGAFLYADFCSGRLWALKREEGVWYTNQLLQAGFNIAGFGEGEDGRLYVSDFYGGRILRIDETFSDADSDGMHDAWETFHGLSTNTSADATGDLDFDHFLNGEEFIAGTDPSDSNSVFKLDNSAPNDTGAFVLQWFSATGRTYAVSRATNLMNDFSVLQSNLVATPPLNVYTDAAAADAGAFYRVKAGQP